MVAVDGAPGRAGKGGKNSLKLAISPEEARVRAIADIVNALIQVCLAHHADDRFSVEPQPAALHMQTGVIIRT
jgi:hypothetical protein